MNATPDAANDPEGTGADPVVHDRVVHDPIVHDPVVHDPGRLRRVGFRSWRRGFREADLILGPYSDKYAPTLTPEQLDHYEALLEVPDQDLYAWIIGREPAPPEFDRDVLHAIQAFRETLFAVSGPRGG